MGLGPEVSGRAVLPTVFRCEKCGSRVTQTVVWYMSRAYKSLGCHECALKAAIMSAIAPKRSLANVLPFPRPRYSPELPTAS